LSAAPKVRCIETPATGGFGTFGVAEHSVTFDPFSGEKFESYDIYILMIQMSL